VTISIIEFVNEINYSCVLRKPIKKAIAISYTADFQQALDSIVSGE
jgi:hypothetical protein